jgi:hypothetical protein
MAVHAAPKCYLIRRVGGGESNPLDTPVNARRGWLLRWNILGVMMHVRVLLYLALPGDSSQSSALTCLIWLRAPNATRTLPKGCLSARNAARRSNSLPQFRLRRLSHLKRGRPSRRQPVARPRTNSSLGESVIFPRRLPSQHGLLPRRRRANLKGSIWKFLWILLSKKTSLRADPRVRRAHLFAGSARGL